MNAQHEAQRTGYQLSVVIASHRPEFISNCVISILAQHDPLVEIIVVADYPIAPFQTQFNQVRWHYHPHKSISQKRNIGIGLAQSAIIGFVDDDCCIALGWCETALAWLTTHPHSSGVEGCTHIEHAKITGPIREYQRLAKRGYRTNNIAYRKDILDKVQRFDERFSVQREDIDLAFTILAQGGVIDYCANMRIQHALRKSSGFDVLKNCINRRFDPLLYKKYPQQYRRHIHSPMPLSLALMGGAELVAGLLLLSHTKVLLVAGLCFLGIYALFLSVRRSGCTAFPYLCAEALSLLIAPWVLWGALIYGSIKFRRLLLG